MVLELRVGVRCTYAVASLRGDLDVTSSAAATSAIAALTDRYAVVIIDLSALEFIDCGSLGALAGVQRQARRRGGELVLAAPAATVGRLLSLTGIGMAFSIYPDAGAAAAHVAACSDALPARAADGAVVLGTGPPAIARISG